MALAEVIQAEPFEGVTLPEPAQRPRLVTDAHFTFAQGFWLENADLLPEGSGTVAQLGANRHGEIQSPGSGAHETATLSFDSTERTHGLYRWQLTVAENGGGRTVSQLDATPRGATAVQKTYDMQGKAHPTISSDVGELAELIEVTVADEFVQDRIGGLRQARERALAEVSRFAVEGLTTFGQRKYEAELKTRQQNLARIGFGGGFQPLDPLV